MLKNPINLTLVNDWGESYNKRNRYKSKHDPKLLPTASTFIISNTNHPKASNFDGGLSRNALNNFKSSMSYLQQEATFGPKDTSVYEPHNRKCYKLRVNRIPTLTELKNEDPSRFIVKNKKSNFKPLLDNSNSWKGEHPDKNFVKQNYENAFKMRAFPDKNKPFKKTEMKNFLKKANYGRVPKYLLKLNSKNINVQARKGIEEAGAQPEPITEVDALSNFKNGIFLSENDRNTLLNQLKENWNKANFEYQKSTHCNNFITLRQAKKKIELEKRLDEFERCISDIEKMNLKTEG